MSRPGATETDQWSEQIAAMREVQQSLVAAGRWRTGPSDLMAVLGIDQQEVLNCRMVRWLFDPLAHHRIGVPMLESLADHLNIALSSPEQATVALEVMTEETRADVVVQCDSRTIVFEAKVGAGEQSGQAARIEERWPGADLVFLTKEVGRTPTTARDQHRWRSLSWTWLATEAMRHVHDTRSSSPGLDQSTNDALAAVAAWATSTERNLA
jgi:hypothetical protein